MRNVQHRNEAQRKEDGMPQKEPVQVVIEFMDRINAADVDGLCARMTEDHVFIDGLGNRFAGRENMRAGWKMYLSMFPDYRVAHEDVFEAHNTVAVFGTASGIRGKRQVTERKIPGGFPLLGRRSSAMVRSRNGAFIATISRRGS